MSSNVAGAVNPPKIPIDFRAAKGHKYFVGQLSESTGTIYRWTPLLIDLTDNRRLYPRKITWKPGQ